MQIPLAGVLARSYYTHTLQNRQRQFFWISQSQVPRIIFDGKYHPSGATHYPLKPFGKNHQIIPRLIEVTDARLEFVASRKIKPSGWFKGFLPGCFGD